MPLELDINEMNGFSEYNKQRYIRGANLVVEVFNSYEFEKRVMDYTWDGNTDFKNSYVDGSFKSKKEIIRMIRSGADKYNPEADSDIDIKVTYYYNRWSSAIGYTYPNTYATWINGKYFNQFTPSSIAGNISHEYTHNLGFSHAYKNNPTRQHTVPYAIGYIVKDIALELEGQQPNDKYQICKRIWYIPWKKKCWWVSNG
jgi:hypothetical protein